MRQLLNERSRRRWAAAEARSHGRGGIAAVARATGISEGTVRRGLVELDGDGEGLGCERVRRAGAGRPGILEREPGLSQALDRLIDPVTRGDPESPLRWTSKSAAKLARAWRSGALGLDRTVLRLLKRMGYSLQANQKTREGADHPTAMRSSPHQRHGQPRDREGQPVISVDTKKRELIGDFKAVGRGFSRRAGRSRSARTTSRTRTSGTRSPMASRPPRRRGLGQHRDHCDTAQFAVNSISSWWEHLGKERYPNATTLTVTADSGGSNNPRTRLWRWSCTAPRAGRPAWTSGSVTSHQAPRSGTRSSTACSASSASTGAASHSRASRSSSTSSPRPPPTPG